MPPTGERQQEQAVHHQPQAQSAQGPRGLERPEGQPAGGHEQQRVDGQQVVAQGLHLVLGREQALGMPMAVRHTPTMPADGETCWVRSWSRRFSQLTVGARRQVEQRRGVVDRVACPDAARTRVARVNLAGNRCRGCAPSAESMGLATAVAAAASRARSICSSSGKIGRGAACRAARGSGRRARRCRRRSHPRRRWARRRRGSAAPTLSATARWRVGSMPKARNSRSQASGPGW